AGVADGALPLPAGRRHQAAARRRPAACGLAAPPSGRAVIASGERVLEEARALARAEARRPLEAALEWGLPKCRTPEERLLYPALLLVLGNLNALVTPRRLEPGDLVDFHLTLSRAYD